MGEFADMAIDDMLSMDEYILTHPEDIDWTEDRDNSWSPFTRFRRFSRRKMPSCKYCKKTHLFWGQDDEGRWRLEDWDEEEEDFVPHVCKMKERWKLDTNTGTSSRQTRVTSRTA